MSAKRNYFVLALVSVMSLVISGMQVHAEIPDAHATEKTSAADSHPVPDSSDISEIPVSLLEGIADIQMQGITRPKQEAILRFSTNGIVKHISVREGQWVQPGQILATLDDRVAQAEVESARAASAATGALTQAKLQSKRAAEVLERTRKASAKGASASFEVEAKEMEYQLAEAVVQQQQEAIELARTRWLLANATCQQMSLEAPIAGEVVLINARVGCSADPNLAAIQIADLTLLETELHLPSELFGRIAAGQSHTLTAGKPVNHQVSAKVVYVSPMIEPTSNTFLVRMEIDNHDRKLPAGFEVWIHKPN